MGAGRIAVFGLICQVQIAVGAAPEITRQPQSVEAYLGNNAVFTVEADGLAQTLSYQWMHDGVAIPGATDTFVSIPEVGAEETGHYAVLVTGQNGSVVSDPAELTVSGPRPTVVDTRFTSGLTAPGLGFLGDWAWTDSMLVVFPDGRVWIAGYYGSATETYPRLVALDADGQPTATFESFSPYGPGGHVVAMARASDDKVYLAGLSDDPGDAPFFIVRLNADGQLDTAFTPIALADQWDFITPHLDGLVIGIGEKLNRFKGDGRPDTGFQIVDQDTQYISATADRDGNLFALTIYPDELHQIGLDGALVARKESVYGEEDSLFTGLDDRLYFEDDFLDHWLTAAINLHDTRYFRVRQIPEDWSEEVNQPVEIVTKHSYLASESYGYLKGRDSVLYGQPRNVFADPVQSPFSSAVDSAGTIFVALIDIHGYALKRKPFNQSSGFDAHYSAGSGPDQFAGLPAMQMHPAGGFLYLAGDFGTFDGHVSPRLVRLHLDPPDPPGIPAKTKAKLMVYRPKGLQLPVDSLFEVEVVVMGSPPFSALLGRYEFSPLIGGGKIISESHARDGVFRFRFRTPEDPSVIIRAGAWTLEIEISDRYGSTVYLADTRGPITWVPNPPKFAAVRRSIHFTGKIQLEAEVYGSPRPSIRWERDGEEIPGAINDTLMIEPTPGNAGHYRCIATNTQGSAQSESLWVTIGAAGAGWPRMTNVSLRAMNRSGEEAIIMGVVADGPRTLVARAVGPSLVSLGVPNPLPDPLLRVFAPDRTQLGWTDSQLVEYLARNLGGFPLIGDSPEASLLVDLPPGRPRTLQAVDAEDRSGNALVEAYVLEDAGGRLRNISERAWIKGSEAGAIAGFVLSDADDFDILVRAAGPSLEGFGVAGFCPDPSISLYRLGEDEPFASNDNWSEDPESDELGAAYHKAGAFAFAPDSRDAALRVTLGPGVYTAVAEGVDEAEGIVLLEVYDLTVD